MGQDWSTQWSDPSVHFPALSATDSWRFAAGAERSRGKRLRQRGKKHGEIQQDRRGGSGETCAQQGPHRERDHRGRRGELAGKSRQPTPEHAPSNYPCALCVQRKSYSSNSKSTGSAVAGLGPWIILGRSLTVQRAEDQSKNSRRALVLPAISSLVKSSTIFYRDRSFRTNAPYKDHLPVHLGALLSSLSPATLFFHPPFSPRSYLRGEHLASPIFSGAFYVLPFHSLNSRRSTYIIHALVASYEWK